MNKEEIEVKVFQNFDNDFFGLLIMLESEVNGETFIGPYDHPMLTTKERWQKEKDLVVDAFKSSILSKIQK